MVADFRPLQHPRFLSPSTAAAHRWRVWIDLRHGTRHHVAAGYELRKDGRQIGRRPIDLASRHGLGFIAELSRHPRVALTDRLEPRRKRSGCWKQLRWQGAWTSLPGCLRNASQYRHAW